MKKIKLNKNVDIKYFDIIYYLLLTAIYVSDFFFIEISKYFIYVLIPFSYYLIFVKKRYEIIIIDIIASRTINGFVVLNNSVAYDIVNWSITLIPSLLLIIIYWQSIIKFYNSRIKEYIFSLGFLVLMLLYSLVNIDDIGFIFNVRILPFLLFILLLPVVIKQININRLLLFYIIYFGLAIFVFFHPQYSEILGVLLTERAILRENIPSFQLLIQDLIRDQGVAFDIRLTGIFSYIFLMLFLFFGKSYIKIIGVIISLFTIILTLSRGATIVSVLILIGFLIEKENIFKIIKYFFIISSIAIIVTYIAFESNLINQRYIDTFNVVNDDNNAISQRQFLIDFAKEKFLQNPFGLGMGELKANTFNLYIGYRGVTDAFWFIILAEIGIIGTLFFFMSCYELFFFSKSKTIILFFIGYLIQLYGTDIPDSRIFYLPILMLLHLIKLKKKEEYENTSRLSFVRRKISGNKNFSERTIFRTN